MIAVLAVVLTFFLATYAVHRYHVPLGWDSAKYLWRTKLAALTGVTNLPSHLPPPINANPDRPGFPTLALEIHSMTGTLPFRLAAVFPAVMAGAIGLGSAAFARSALRRRPWESALIGMTVATSTFIARLMNPEAYQDNLLALAVVMASLALTSDALGRDRGRRARIVAAAALLASVSLIHWETLLLVAAIVGASATPFLRSSWRRWRRDPGVELLGTTAGALAAVALGALALGAGLFFGLLGGPHVPDTSAVAKAEFTTKFHRDLTVHPLWFVVPMAVIGTLALVRARRRENGEPATGLRWMVALAGTWVLVTVAAAVLLIVGRPVPAHRFLAETLPFPILVAVGGLAVAGAAARRAGGQRGRRGRAMAAGGIVVVAILGFSAFSGQAYWLSKKPPLNPWLIREVTAAGSYIKAAGVSNDRPIVFVANPQSNWGNNLALMAQQVRAALPSGRIMDAFVYLGDPSEFLAGRATDHLPLDGPVPEEFAQASREYFDAIRPLFPRYPVTFLLQEMNPDPTYFTSWAGSHPDGEVAPGVFVVRGPVLSDPIPQRFAPVGHKSFLPLSISAWMVVGVLFVAGLGWAVVALGRRVETFTALAIAPAVGVAVMVTSGVVTDRLGTRLTTAAGWAVPAAVAAVGALAAVVILVRGRAGRPEPAPYPSGDGASGVDPPSGSDGPGEPPVRRYRRMRSG